MPHSNKRKKSSAFSAWFTGINSNDNYVGDEPIAKKRKEVKVYHMFNVILGLNHLSTKSNYYNSVLQSASFSKANVKRRISSCSSSTYSSANGMSTSQNVVITLY